MRALGWALFHSLWQGIAVGVLLAGLLALLKGYSPNLRYLFSCCALMLMLIFPVATIRTINISSARPIVEEASVPAAAMEKEAVTGREVVKRDLLNSSDGKMEPGLERQPGAERLEWLLPWLTMVWLSGVTILSLRLLGGFLHARRLKGQKTRAVAERWQEMVGVLSKRLGVARSVRILESSLVQVPTVVGWLRPIILLPISSLAGLTPQQLETILAHELAHIKRHDYLVNLIQTVVETLMFYHPAAWWISRQIRIEREQACDDLVVAACGDPLVYARALTSVERFRRDMPQLALASNGGVLLGRIHRLVGASRRPPRHSSLLAGAVGIALLFIFSLAMLAIRPEGRLSAIAPVEASSFEIGAAAGSVKSPHNQELSGKIAPLVARDSVTGESPEIRRVAIEALGEHAGTVIVMDPNTGIVHTIVNQEWALRRGWNPASTIKLVTGLAGVAERAIDPAEKIRVPDRTESIDLTRALALSNNPYFKSLGERVGTERLLSYSRRLGLGELTGINYENEYPGRLPSNQRRVKSGHLGAYGEGIEVTPIQLATLVSAIANGGTLLVPHVLSPGQEPAKFQRQTRRRIDIPGETLTQITQGMVAAVTEGTAMKAYDPTFLVAGKTGTIAEKESNVGLFVSYAPVDTPRLVVVVITRGKDEYGSVAAEIAGKIYRALKNFC
jgi:beta-lactamase regulating signal transducer with metallopeptidase domain/beta-lactamase class D